MVDREGHLHQVERDNVRNVEQVSMNYRSQPVRGLSESGYERGNVSAAENQKRYHSYGPE